MAGYPLDADRADRGARRRTSASELLSSQELAALVGRAPLGVTRASAHRLASIAACAASCRVLLIGAIVLDVTYWTLWFSHREWIASEEDEAYYEFENAFPLADTWLGVTCLLALITLRAGRPSALLWLLCAGELGAVPVLDGPPLRPGERDLHPGWRGELEAVIVKPTLIFGVTVLTWSWGHRGELLSGK